MLFSSALFVFCFLPIVLGVYFVVHPRLRNAWLLAVSLVFYAWGEPVIALVMLLSIAANYAFGLWVERARERGGGLGVLAAFVRAGLVKSNGEARRQIQGGGLRVNDAAVADEAVKLSPRDVVDGAIKLSLGKKRHVLLKVI